MKTSREKKDFASLIRSAAGLISALFCMCALMGCVTTESSVLMPEQDGSYEKVKISKIVLKNGEKIDCTDKIVYFEMSKKDSTGMFAITRKSYMVAGGASDSASLRKTQYIPLSDVLLVYRGVEKVDVLKTTGAVLGVITGTAAGLVVIAFTLGVGGFASK